MPKTNQSKAFGTTEVIAMYFKLPLLKIISKVKGFASVVAMGA
jgi:hypothetical protein